MQIFLSKIEDVRFQILIILSIAQILVGVSTIKEESYKTNVWLEGLIIFIAIIVHFISFSSLEYFNNKKLNELKKL